MRLYVGLTSNDINKTFSVTMKASTTRSWDFFTPFADAQKNSGGICSEKLIRFFSNGLEFDFSNGLVSVFSTKEYEIL